MRPRRLLALAGTAALVTAAAGPLTASSADAATAAGGTATVSVLHAVPGLTVDVYANGKELLPGFRPGTLTDPQQLPAGTYDLKVFKAGANPKSAKPAIEASGVTVPAGANVTVVAHLSATGTPELTPYVNDTSRVAAGQARLTVRHDAAAPAVDVRAGGKVIVAGLTNPQSRSLSVPAGTVSADVVLAGTSTRAIGPAAVDLREGTSTIVYAWGSAKDKNLALAVQTIGGLGSSPTGVAAGEAGLAGTGSTTASLALFALAGAAALTGVVAVRRRPARR